MNLYLLISVLVFALFLSYFWTKHGIQSSISATYRLLLAGFPVGAHSIWVGLFFMLAVAILSTGQSAWYFLSAVGLLGVGAFPEYWEKDQVKNHVTAAYIAFAFPLLKLLLFTPGTVVPAVTAAWIVFAALLTFKIIRIPYRTTIVEITGFILIITFLSL